MLSRNYVYKKIVTILLTIVTLLFLSDKAQAHNLPEAVILEEIQCLMQERNEIMNDIHSKLLNMQISKDHLDELNTNKSKMLIFKNTIDNVIGGKIAKIEKDTPESIEEIKEYNGIIEDIYKVIIEQHEYGHFLLKIIRELKGLLEDNYLINEIVKMGKNISKTNIIVPALSETLKQIHKSLDSDLLQQRN